MGKKKQITQKQIAEELGVSQGIVSVILRKGTTSIRISDDVRRHVLQYAYEHGYRLLPGSFQPQKTGNIIGLVVRKEQLLLFDELIYSLSARFATLGYRCVLSRVNLDGDDSSLEDHLDRIVSCNYAGIVCIGHYCFQQPGVIASKLESYPNVVFLGMPYGSGSVPCVKIDYSCGVKEAVLALHAKGRRKIALCLNDMQSEAMKGRFAGYCQGLNRLGLPVQPDLCWIAADYGMRAREGEDVREVADRIIETFYEKRHPDALIMSNDEWAAMMLRQLRRHKIRSPEEVAVVGYGNHKVFTHFSDPELSSISHGNEEIVSALADILHGQISGQLDRSCPEQVSRVIQTHYIGRESCG